MRHQNYKRVSKKAQCLLLRFHFQMGDDKQTGFHYEYRIDSPEEAFLSLTLSTDVLIESRPVRTLRSQLLTFISY